MSGVVDNIRAKMKRRFSHKKEPETANFDEYDSGDEETATYLNKEIEDAEKDESAPMGRPNSLLNRMISHGNKKTEEQIARDAAEAQAREQKIKEASVQDPVRRANV